MRLDPLDQNGTQAGPKRKTSWYDRLPAIASVMFGTVIAATVVGGYWGNHLDFKPAAALLFFLCLAAIFSYLWHLIFVLHPRKLEKRLEEEQRQRHAVSDPARPGPDAGPSA